jgi:hypothetical protein
MSETMDELERMYSWCKRICSFRDVFVLAEKRSSSGFATVAIFAVEAVTSKESRMT